MDSCSLCCDESKAWAVGPCDHATCLMCSARLRILCEQRDCPVCREKLNKVVVSDSIKPFSLPPHGSKVDRKYGYLFWSPQLYDRYKALQAFRCTKCRDKPTFGSFALLRDHARKTHGLLYCDICCENLKLFPFELRQYSRQELTRHRRDGDPDDTSYKGHPLCQFCDERYFDNDALHAHLRKVHFWCHFCESDGKQDYYSTYPLLRDHFRQEHYLCVEGPCQQEKFTSVFRSKLDLQVHRAKVHSKGMTKAEAKQMRQLEVEFMYDRSGGGGGGVANLSGGRGQWQHVPQRSRQSKTRECEDKSALASVEPTQQQRDSRSPPAGGKKQKASAVSLRPGGGQHLTDQPPRLKQKLQSHQKQQTTQPLPSSSRAVTVDDKLVSASGSKTLSVSTPSAVGGGSKAKKPPGFAVKTDTASEWPDLLALSISPKEEPTSAMLGVQQPDVGYSPLEPSHFPPLSMPILPSAANNNLSTMPTIAPFERSRVSLSAAVASNLPPGFVSPQWDLIQGSFYKPPSLSNLSMRGTMGPGLVPQRVTEGSVINTVREALNHDREKFNHFRNLSGWYRNSEITVQEYVTCCQELFGELKWSQIGPQLAQVMPIQSKRNELLQTIYAGVVHSHRPPSHHALSSYFTGQMPTAQPPLQQNNISGAGGSIHMSRSDPGLLQMSRAAKWGVMSNRMVPNWESESEYPALHSGNTAPAVTPRPPGLPAPTWKARVPPV